MSTMKATKARESAKLHVPKAKKPPTTAPLAWVGLPAIDYPREGEEVGEGWYGIRISVDPSEAVEVSINGDGWRPCRWSVGHWWFDWQPRGVGPCAIAARARTAQSGWKESALRTCEVVPGV